MAPSVADTTGKASNETVITTTSKPVLKREPLKLGGFLDSTFESFDVTPVIGREFPTANLKEWLHAPNSDDLLRDLAATGMIPLFSFYFKYITCLRSANVQDIS